MPHDHKPLRRATAFVATVHVVVALLYWFVLGVTIVHDFGPDKWGWFWQSLPTELLRTRATESIWYMHGQPPLWNILGAILIKLFGSLHMEALQALHIALGAGIAGMCVQIVGRVTQAPRVALATGLIVALHPALFLFEAYALYTTVAAFLVTSAAYLVTRAQEVAATREDSGDPTAPGGQAALGFVAVVVALIMTRSVYHLMLLFGAVPLAVLLIGRPTRRQFAVLLLLVLLPITWYGKNQIQYGFFGASSWYGMGLWRTALFDQERAVLDDLYDTGTLSPVVRVDAFAAPIAYRSLGYDEESTIPVLSGNDAHNINIPAISRDYRSSAVLLIKASPAQYLRNVMTAYGNFATPSTGFDHLEDNRDRISLHAAIEVTTLGRPLVARLENKLGSGYYGSFYYLLFPAVLLLYGLQVTRRLHPRDVLQRISHDAAPLFMATIVSYTIVIACAMELGENLRFKFVIEPVFLALSAIVGYRLVSRRLRSSGQYSESAKSRCRSRGRPRCSAPAYEAPSETR